MKRLRAKIWREILLIGAIMAFGIVIYSSRSDLSRTWELLRGVSLGAALILPLLQLTSYFMISSYYRSFIQAFGQTIGHWRALALTTALNFVNQILPSGGASGITYLIYAFRDVAKPAEITLIQLGRYLLAFLTYVPLLLVAYVWLHLSGDLNPELNLAILILFAISLPGTVLLVLALKNQMLVDVLVAKVLGLLNRLAQVVTRKDKPWIEISKRHGFLREFHDGVAFIKSQRGRLLKPYLFMQLSTLAEVSIVIAAFWVLGAHFHPGVILIAFTAANVAGAISIIPGDVGVHELAIITVLSYVGVDKGTAIAGTLLYRVFNKLIVMSIGFGFYVRLIRPLVDNARKPAAST